MGKILDNPFNVTFSRTAPVPGAGGRVTMFQLTNTGNRELHEMDGNEDIYPVMVSLQGRTKSTGDIAKDESISERKVEQLLKSAMKKGFVKVAPAGE